MKKQILLFLTFAFMTGLRAQNQNDIVYTWLYNCNFENPIESGAWRLTGYGSNSWCIDTATNNTAGSQRKTTIKAQMPKSTLPVIPPEPTPFASPLNKAHTSVV